MQSAAIPVTVCQFSAVPEASTTKKENLPCSLRRVHGEQGTGYWVIQGINNRPEGHTGLGTVPALLGPGRQKAVVLFCFILSKPVSQSPVQCSVSLLPWRRRLGLEALSFSVSISGPTSCLLPLCRWRGARVTLVFRSWLCRHWCCVSCPRGPSLHSPMHWLGFLQQVPSGCPALGCAQWRVAPGWWRLQACPATAHLYLLTSASLSLGLGGCSVSPSAFIIVCNLLGRSRKG